MKHTKHIKQKHAQLKIGESILVLIIFFILLTMGLVFYAKVQTHLTKQDNDEFNAKRSIDMALAIKFLPELQCTVQATEEFDCIDIAKLLIFSEVLKNKPVYQRYYAQLFPNAKITIKQAFASEGPLISKEGILMFDNKYVNEEQAGSLNILFFPVTLYDSLTDSNCFGFIELEVYG
ncbi:hypothetical protein J4434_06150 [Candidatus Woesearchaeota archaeon]|nr:hypothetical protein [Candidatus Woesearchaeota archaeon]